MAQADCDPIILLIVNEPMTTNPVSAELVVKEMVVVNERMAVESMDSQPMADEPVSGEPVSGEPMSTEPMPVSSNGIEAAADSVDKVRLATGTNLSVGDEFASFADFEACLKSWWGYTNVSWVKADSKTIAAHNKKVVSSVRMFHPKFMYKYLTLICKRGGECKPRSRGIRPNQK